MLTYKIEDDFETTLQAYWDMFFDEDYNKGLYQRLAITRDVNKDESTGEGDDLVRRRSIVLTPQRDVPALFRKFAKGAVQYTENSVFTRKTNTIEVTIVSGFASDKFTSGGTYTVVDLGNGKVRRTFAGHIECRIRLVGGKLEKHIEGEVRRSYRDTTDFTRAWLRDHAKG